MGLSCTLHALSEVDASALVVGNRNHQPQILGSCELDKAWGAIHYFISGLAHTNPANSQLKDFLVSGVLLDEASEHVAIHSSSEVSAFAIELKATSAEELMTRFDPDRMNQINVYGNPWDESGREYVLQFVEPFRKFIIDAAETGRAVLIVIC